MSLTAEGTPLQLAERFRAVRGLTLALAAPLSEADVQVQSMPDASPTKWHLAHTTWFFETMVLERAEPRFQPHHPAFRVLFNSYYHAVGEQHARPQRGLITRPGLADVLAYRDAVDARVLALLAEGQPPDMLALLTLGLHHEQQHQELVLTDLKHLLACNPLHPAYRPVPDGHTGSTAAAAPGWIDWGGGPVDIGHAGPGFAFDNETPRHRHWLAPHALADRLVTQGEFAAFVADGGYRDARWWLSAGWDWVCHQRAQTPLYWHADGDHRWQVFTLHGLLPLAADAPVLHLNLYEADAYARWAAAHSGLPLRLPTEAEWEHAAARSEAGAEAHAAGLDDPARAWLHPLPAATPPPAGPRRLQQALGAAWQWTSSAYCAYPGYCPWPGTVGEYNGKFMVGQNVLRGGSFGTPRGHARLSYRNFFPADARWQFSGLRLARDLDSATT
jgi:ergothioneine biosynthesis protein EgtB